MPLTWRCDWFIFDKSDSSPKVTICDWYQMFFFPDLVGMVSILLLVMSFSCFMVYLTNRFQVAMHLFSNRSQIMSKCGKNKKVAHEAQPSVSLMLLPHFGVLCDLLLNRHTATWNLFVLYNKELKKALMMMSLYVCPPIDHKWELIRMQA